MPTGARMPTLVRAAVQVTWARRLYRVEEPRRWEQSDRGADIVAWYRASGPEQRLKRGQSVIEPLAQLGDLAASLIVAGRGWTIDGAAPLPCHVRSDSRWLA